MSIILPLMVAGAKHGNNGLDVFAPFNGETIATLETANFDTVERALATAYQLHRNRSAWLTVARRIEILEKTVLIMQREAELLAVQAATEGGKPLRDSRIEVERAISGVKACVDHLRTDSVSQIPMGLDTASSNRIVFSIREPIGPVVAISAFNHPLNLIVHQVVPAIAAGNPVIVKPAEDTPLSCYRFVEILYEAGLPREWCAALVVGDLEVATALVTDPRVAFFSFIGSSQVGWMLRSKLAPGTRCALEHGGVAPVIVEQDADLGDVIPQTARGGFYHAGQVCVSVQRIFCHKSIVMEFAEGLSRYAETMQVGNPLNETTDVGPLIRGREVNRVHEWVEEGRKAGAECLTGGTPLSESCYSPTVISNAPDQIRLSREEVFGPVVCIYSFDELDTAIAKANALPFAFQAAVFTRDLDRALYVSRNIDASSVMVNDHTAFRLDWMPFAGLRQSGLGVGGIPYTLHEMQIEKMTIVHSKSV